MAVLYSNGTVDYGDRDLDSIGDTIDSTTLFYGSIRRYLTCKDKPHYPMPAIPYEVVWGTHSQGYVGIVYIDDVSVPDDPIIVYGWDTWHGRNIV